MSAYQSLGYIPTGKTEESAIREAEAEQAAANRKYNHLASISPRRRLDNFPLHPRAKAAWELLGELNVEVATLRASRPTTSFGRRNWLRNRLPHLVRRGVLDHSGDTQHNSIPNHMHRVPTQGIEVSNRFTPLQSVDQNPDSSSDFCRHSTGG